MYHIKNDKRCLRSADMILQALLELLNKKPYMDISVSDLQKASGVGRSTFYRLFDTVDDVVVYAVDIGFQDLVRDFEELSWKDFTLKCLQTVIEQNRQMSNLISGNRGYLIFPSLRRNIQRALDLRSEAFPEEAHYSFGIFAAACISVITVWNENGQKESIEELADILGHFLNYDAMLSVFEV